MVDVEISRARVSLRPFSWRALVRWQYFGIILILAVTLAFHFAIINHPGELIFDEQHYVPDAKSILAGENTLRFEHPPLGKLFIAAGIWLFGDNPMGWRFFSVMAGAAAVVLFYFICRRLMGQRGSLIATFLFALENMSFVQSSVAMLDVFMFVFTLAAFLFYLQKRNILSGVSVGLSALGKLIGALSLVTIAIHWFFSGRKSLERFLVLVFLAPISFVGLMPLFDFFVSRHLVNPLERIRTMWQMSSSLTFATVEHSAASRPWWWVLRPDAIAYYYNPDYIGVVSYTVWALIIPIFIYMIIRAKQGNDAALFGLSWFAGIYLVWIPMTFITNRISYPFYFYPAIGSICIGIAVAISDLLDRTRTRAWRRRKPIKALVITYLVGHAAVFVIFSPVFSQLIKI